MAGPESSERIYVADCGSCPGHCSLAGHCQIAGRRVAGNCWMSTVAIQSELGLSPYSLRRS